MNKFILLFLFGLNASGQDSNSCGDLNDKQLTEIQLVDDGPVDVVNATTPYIKILGSSRSIEVTGNSASCFYNEKNDGAIYRNDGLDLKNCDFDPAVSDNSETAICECSIQRDNNLKCSRIWVPLL